jgi:hypothetical protein
VLLGVAVRTRVASVTIGWGLCVQLLSDLRQRVRSPTAPLLFRLGPRRQCKAARLRQRVRLFPGCAPNGYPMEHLQIERLANIA